MTITRFYSATTGGFYESQHHAGAMPEDVCEVSESEFQSLMTAPSLGFIIVADEDGRPILADPQPLTVEQRCSLERSWRYDVMLKACAVRDRHRDEQELFRPTTLTPERFVELLGYIQKLRDWPQSAAFPDTTQRPVVPTWLAEQT